MPVMYRERENDERSSKNFYANYVKTRLHSHCQSTGLMCGERWGWREKERGREGERERRTVKGTPTYTGCEQPQ